MITQHPSAFRPYLEHGWCLVPVPLGTKGPNHTGWNTKESCICGSKDILEGFGAGLGHAFSQTCAIDLDDLFAAELMFAQRGLDLNAYLDAPDAVQIVSGRPGSGKLLYELIDPLPSKKLTLAGKTALEFRCGTTNGKTVQDVLPPSAHPSGTTYQWAGRGSWQHLPPLPFELWMWWQELLTIVEPATPAEQTDYPMEIMTQALNTVDPDCPRDPWIECLMGMKATNDPSAFEITRQWSARSEAKYPGDREFSKQWQSLRNDHPAGITPATIIHHAKAAGWRPPPPDISALFKDVTPADPGEMMLSGQPVPPMEATHYPKLLADYALEIATTMGSSIVVPITAGMSAAAACADARSRLTLKQGMKVAPVIWNVVVATPSAKKTPASEPMFAPLRQIEADDRSRHAAELHAWEAAESCHMSAQKAYLAASADPAYLLAGQDASMLPQVPELAPKPVPLRLQVQDITSQKLAYLCADRPAGLACILDEGKSWLAKVTDNRSGDSRSTWTQSYESKPHYFDRVGTGSLYIDNLAVSMYMNVQPLVIEQYLAAASEDGLMQRFLPAIVPDHDASCVGVGRPEFLSHAGAWEHCLRRIHVATTGGRDYTLCADGQALVAEFEHYLERLKQEERIIASDANLQSAIGKLLGNLGRTIFIQHLIEDPDAITVPHSTVARVIDAFHHYTIPALRHLYALGDKHGTFEQWVAEYILTGSESVISVSDVIRAARRPLERLKVSGWRANELTESILLLLADASCGWLKELPMGHGEKSKRFAINTVIRERFADRRRHVARIKQDRLDKSREIIRTKHPDYPRRMARGYEEAA